MTIRVAGIVFVGAIVAGAPLAGAQSLADVARQTEARGSAGTSSKKYTNADLEPVAAAAPAPAAVPEVAAPGGYLSASTGRLVSADEIVARSQAIITQNKQNMGEDYWRGRAASLRDELQRARDKVELLSTAPPPRTEGLRRAAATELERARKTLANVDQRWQDFEASAGFARVPAAWLQP